MAKSKAGQNPPTIWPLRRRSGSATLNGAFPSRRLLREGNLYICTNLKARKMSLDLHAFLLESNKIEGIAGVRDHEIAASEAFLKLGRIEIDDLETLVSQFQPGAILRDLSGLDVQVGNYVPPRGGRQIRVSLESLLASVNARGRITPHLSHLAYEGLHPFTDGNGRSGRMLWLWLHVKSGRHCPLGFLRHWYYESLDNSDR